MFFTVFGGFFCGDERTLAGTEKGSANHAGDGRDRCGRSWMWNGVPGG
jgi:hypothetical protein